ncbi:MAG: type II toxin-antitoxin system HicB family antitoxin [Clostridia bacterium]|nr:type II toxin-antitoxin system HicB family antitoxin [Clostridia bacterium]
MKYVYSAIFTKLENDEYSVEIPDLPGCITCGYGLAETIFMASDAMAMWLWDAENKKENIPKSKKIESVEKNQFVNLIVADTDDYRKRHENRAVKKTLSIPSWLNSEAEQAGVNFSQVLQEALREKLKTE